MFLPKQEDKNKHSILPYILHLKITTFSCDVMTSFVFAAHLFWWRHHSIGTSQCQKSWDCIYTCNKVCFRLWRLECLSVPLSTRAPIDSIHKQDGAHLWEGKEGSEALSTSTSSGLSAVPTTAWHLCARPRADEWAVTLGVDWWIIYTYKPLNNLKLIS